jgi:hypothetical protein
MGDKFVGIGMRLRRGTQRQACLNSSYITIIYPWPHIAGCGNDFALTYSP